MKTPLLSHEDSRFLAYLRGVAILAIVVVHLGGWVLPPYTEFLVVFVPVFFFLSGAVSYYSFQRAQSTLNYLAKRLVGMFLPYYLLCVFWLVVYVAVNSALPAFSGHDLLCWLTIRPANSAMLFSLGQVWFLHTLVVILVASPVFFELFRRAPRILAAIMILPIALATTQMFCDIDNYFYLAGNNFYKPIVHSFFFVLGCVFFASPGIRKKSLLTGLALVALLASCCLVELFRVDINCSEHTFAPDLYYVAVSLCAIAVLLISQPLLLGVCDKIHLADITLKFLHRYTFPIFLLHSFAVYVSEELFGLVHPKSGYLQYAATKFTIVMLITCILAIPFGFASTWLIKVVLERCTRILPKRGIEPLVTMTGSRIPTTHRSLKQHED